MRARMKIKPIGPNPSLLITTKEGMIKELYYSSNAGQRMVAIHNGRPRLAPEAQDRGYKLLEECYSEDPREAIASKGYQTYRDWNRAAKAGRAPRHVVKGPAGDRQCTAPFPERWLPQEVIKRRAGKSTASESTWEAPDLDAPALDESGEVAEKAKPRKVKSEGSRRD
jgi:hypothetical protein